MNKYIPYLFFLLCGIVLIFGSCGKNTVYNDEYFENLPLDTVMTPGNFIQVGVPMTVIFHYPAGCNNLHASGFIVKNDTLDFFVTYRFYDNGTECAHGPGVDTIQVTVNGVSPGEYIIHYVKPDSMEVDYPLLIVGAI